MDLSQLEPPKKENKTPMKVMNGSRPSSPDREMVRFFSRRLPFLFNSLCSLSICSCKVLFALALWALSSVYGNFYNFLCLRKSQLLEQWSEHCVLRLTGHVCVCILNVCEHDHLGEFHQIYGFDALKDKDELVTLWGQRSKVVMVKKADWRRHTLLFTSKDCTLYWSTWHKAS